MAERAPVRDDQRAVTQAELLLHVERLDGRLKTVEGTLGLKADASALAHLTEVVELKLQNVTTRLDERLTHFEEKQDEIYAFLKRGIGIILVAVLTAILASVIVQYRSAQAQPAPQPPTYIPPRPLQQLIQPRTHPLIPRLGIEYASVDLTGVNR